VRQTFEVDPTTGERRAVPAAASDAPAADSGKSDAKPTGGTP
jgi:hypothetical protein